MKKILILLMSMLFTITLCSCSSASDDGTHTYTANGRNYIVNTIDHTISDGAYTYQYTHTRNASGYKIEITYPDGSSAWWGGSNDSNTGTGGHSDDFSYNTVYASSSILCDAVLDSVPKPFNWGKLGFCIVAIIIGIICLASPYSVWYLEYGIRYKNAEPSELALWLNRIVGIAIIFFAVILLLYNA